MSSLPASSAGQGSRPFTRLRRCTRAAVCASAAASFALALTCLVCAAPALAQGVGTPVPSPTAAAPLAPALTLDSTLELTPITVALITFVAALLGTLFSTLLTWAFARRMERAKQREAFAALHFTKRMETALQIRSELCAQRDAFLACMDDCADADSLRAAYARTRRSMVGTLGQSAFTNVLIYGYAQGLLHSGVLHDVELFTGGKVADIRLDLRRRLEFVLQGYSLALLRSDADVWDIAYTPARTAAAETLAKTDVQTWYDEQRDMRRFTYKLSTMSRQDLAAQLST